MGASLMRLEIIWAIELERLVVAGAYDESLAGLLGELIGNYLSALRQQCGSITLLGRYSDSR